MSKPEYAKKEKKECKYRHVGTPKKGGEMTGAGKYYAKNNTLRGAQSRFS